MKNAEKGAFTLVLVVIPVVPNGYADMQNQDWIMSWMEERI